MKFSLDINNKKGNFEADVEKLVEKGMDNYEKGWKDKFNIKHNAKKEIMELKHKQKIEKENNYGKSNFIQKMQEEKRKTIQLENEEKRKLLEIELGEKRRLEEEKKKIVKLKIFFSVIIAVISLIVMTIGFELGVASGDPNSSFYIIGLIGIFLASPILLIWKKEEKDNVNENPNYKHKRKRR